MLPSLLAAYEDEAAKCTPAPWLIARLCLVVLAATVRGESEADVVDADLCSSLLAPIADDEPDPIPRSSTLLSLWLRLSPTPPDPLRLEEPRASRLSLRHSLGSRPPVLDRDRLSCVCVYVWYGYGCGCVCRGGAWGCLLSVCSSRTV